MYHAATVTIDKMSRCFAQLTKTSEHSATMFRRYLSALKNTPPFPRSTGVHAFAQLHRPVTQGLTDRPQLDSSLLSLRFRQPTPCQNLTPLLLVTSR